MKQYNCNTINYKRHLTLEEAEAFKKKWDYEGDNERRTSHIQYKKKTNDYTVRYGKAW